MRSLEALPATARVRFIDEGADYQTGAAVVRGDGEGGGIDADLPAVCGPGLAKALARRLLEGDGDGSADGRPRAAGRVAAGGRGYW